MSGTVIIGNLILGEGIPKIGPVCREILSDVIGKWNEKGMTGKRPRAMILGIPNVGKSSLVNRLCGSKKAKVEDRPGVTLSKQWVATSSGFDLLDMPGVLWPKFEDRQTGRNLAFTGAIRDAILDTELLAGELCEKLAAVSPDLFFTRYKLDGASLAGAGPIALLEAVAKKRGFLISGGELDLQRASDIVLDEFRGGKIGRISLEAPDSEQEIV